MKKSFLMIVAAAGLMIFAACGNKSGNTSDTGEAAFAADTLTFDEYKWFTWTIPVPQGKGYELTTSLPEQLKDFHSSTDIMNLLGDKVLVVMGDFEGKSLDDWKTLVNSSDYTGSLKGLELQDVKVAGRNAIRYKLESGGSELQHDGYGYIVDFTDFPDGYKCFYLSVYAADGQPNKIEELMNDEEVKFILDNMTVTPKND